MTNYEKLNADNVLLEVEKKILEIENGIRKKYYIRDIYRELSIFDWWCNYLTLTQLKDMRKFLKEAIKLGFNGYVCFKVGRNGCANGMWAHKESTTNGYSPKCDFLYKSFTPQYNYWSFEINDVMYPSRQCYDTIKTIKDLEKIFQKTLDNNN